LPACRTRYADSASRAALFDFNEIAISGCSDTATRVVINLSHYFPRRRAFALNKITVAAASKYPKPAEIA
jgi:hypothetical protein